MTTPSDTVILVAEDEEDDALLLERAFKDANVGIPLHIATDGQQCVDYLEEIVRVAMRGEFVRAPCLMLLDLKMPRLTGMDVLRWRRDQPVLRTLPAVVFSSSGNQQDVELAYMLGANAFLLKPPTNDARTALARLIGDFWVKSNRPPMMCAEGLTTAIKLHSANGFRRAAL